MVAFVTLVPALCRSFTRSPRVVLGFLLTVLVIILTPRGEILHGAPDRGRLSVVLYVFHFLIIAPTVDFFTPSCLPIADSVFPAWCRSTILFLVSFDSSLVFFSSYFVSHSWGKPMMKITGLSHLFKWENLHNWWLTKYFFAPLYIYIQSHLNPLSSPFWCSVWTSASRLHHI